MIDMRHGDEPVVAHLPNSTQKPKMQMLRSYVLEEIGQRRLVVLADGPHMDGESAARSEVGAPVCGAAARHRPADELTAGRGFESLYPCQYFRFNLLPLGRLSREMKRG